MKTKQINTSLMETSENIIISIPEHELLTKHLQAANLSDYNKNRLHNVLKSASVVSEEAMPEDVVSLESMVKIREKESGREFEFQIVLPSHADIRKKRVSVFAPVAIAVMGFRVGDFVEWEMPDGIKSMEILSAEPKPAD